MKDIYSPLIDFIESTDGQDAKFKTFIEIQLLFQLISKIADNHHRTLDFLVNWGKYFYF